MRLLGIDLRAYGPFTGVSLDLAGAGKSFHLVHGPNEAGKSSLARAIAAGLLGIDARTRDNFIHANGALRIGLRIERAREGEIAFVRRKGLKRTLLDPADEAPLDDAALETFLGEGARGTFGTLFSIDHEALVRGGRALLESRGELGESLVGAAVGGERIRAIRRALAAADEAIFKPSGQLPPLNRAIADLREARARVAAESLAARDWAERSAAHDGALRARAAVLERLGALRAREALLRRVARSLPKLARLRELREALARLGPVPPLPAGAAEERLLALKSIELAGASRAEATRSAAQLAEERGRLAVAEALLERAPAIRELAAEVVLRRKGSAEIASLRAERARLEAEVARRLEARPEAALRLGARERARLSRLVAEGPALRRRAADTRAALERAAEARSGVDPASLPLRETVARFEKEVRELERAARAVADERAALAARAREVDLELEAQRLQAGEVPTEAELAAVRARRDAKWTWIREAGAAPAPVVVAAFERDVAAADGIADRMRREADRVARKAALFAERESIASRRAAADAEDAARAARQAAHDAGWAALWAPAGVAPLPPLEMQAWLARVEAGAAEHERARTEEGRARADLERWREDWGAALAPLGLPADARPEDVGPELDEIGAAVGDAEAARACAERAAALECEAARFAEALAPVVAAAAPDLAGRDPAEAAAALAGRLDAAEAARARRDAIDARLADQGRAVAAAERAIEAAEATLRAHSAQAGCAGAAELGAAIARAAEAREASRRLADVEAALLEGGGGRTIDQLAAEAAGADPDRLGADVGALEREAADLEAERSRLDEAVGAERNALARMDGGGAAAAAAEGVESALARVRALARRAAALRIARTLLGRAIERYRETHQSPLLARGGELFARLTQGSFEGLALDFDGDDEPAIRGVRAGGARVPVEGMSEGTRDQLYLALRLATIERRLEGAEPLPLVLDDLLVQFDDGRALAALAVLGEISRRTQVIFLTHHEHVIALARRAIPERALEVHDLLALRSAAAAAAAAPGDAEAA